MAQPTVTAIRQALANTITTQTGVRASANRPEQVSPPFALVHPLPGSFVTYSETFAGSARLRFQIIVFAARADSTAGQDILDPYVSTSGPQSVWAAVQADQRLGGTVEDAVVVEAANYGVVAIGGVEYVACHFLTEVMI